MKVAVAMSGGVDSSVAAALMVEAGHEVVGLAMKTHNLEPRHNRACCTPDDMRDARRVAASLDIPFYVLNYAELFREQVVGPFAEAYARGETPNPCIVCNEQVKFVPLLERARLLGAERLVTGHYARIGNDEQGRAVLLRGLDPDKDQSYFLYRMTQEQLQQVWFPVGHMTKPQVREHAERLGLVTAQKHESQEICFVGDEGYPATVEKILNRSLPEGNIVDQDGKVLGRHRGIHYYTVGQRRGLGIAAETPLYVIRVNAADHTVVVGPRNALLDSGLRLKELRWTAAIPEDDEEVLVQQRYRGRPVSARLFGERLHFAEPTLPGAPGQAAVIFRGDQVLGGGVIASTSTSTSTLPVL